MSNMQTAKELAITRYAILITMRRVAKPPGIPLMPKIAENFPWKDPSTNGLRYLFTTKHHGGPGSAGQCQWLPELEFRAEFWIFDQADVYQLLDDKGRLFGMLKTPTSKCKTNGTQDEQIAVFYPPNSGNEWHGNPSYPLSGVHSRSGEYGKPKKMVFDKMIAVELLTEEQASRLKRGRHI
jgi:hypothetical protein